MLSSFTLVMSLHIHTKGIVNIFKLYIYIASVLVCAMFPCCTINACPIEGSRYALPTCCITATDNTVWFYSGVKFCKVLLWCIVYDVASFISIWRTKRISTHMKTKKSYFSSHFLQWTDLLSLKLLVWEKSRVRTIVIHRLPPWLCAFMPSMSNLSRVAIDPGIFLRTPVTTYLCL